MALVSITLTILPTPCRKLFENPFPLFQLESHTPDRRNGGNAQSVYPPPASGNKQATWACRTPHSLSDSQCEQGFSEVFVLPAPGCSAPTRHVCPARLDSHRRSIDVRELGNLELDRLIRPKDIPVSRRC